MAPICSKTSLSANSTSSSKMNSCHCGHSTNSLWDSYLPISRRGLFFQDSFFGHAHSLFDDALRQVLGRWGETELLTDRWDDASLRLSNNLSRYRQLRAHNLKEENLAITASSDDTCHKIVMDVHDFMNGEVKVKVVGEREVMVEGHTKTTQNGDLSVSSHSFRRHFSLPELTKMEAISAVMSSDGVLTITAPKIVNQTRNECTTIPIKVEGTTNAQTASNSATSSTNTKVVINGEGECDCKCRRQQYEAQNSTSHQQTTQRVPIKINSTLVQSDSQSSEVQNSSEHSSNLEETSEQVRNTSKVSTNSSVNSDTVEKEPRTDSEIHTQKPSSTPATEVRNVPLSTSSFLPITRRGQFFSDSFFENSRNDFQNAVNEILRKWGETELLTATRDDTNLRISNNLSRYRQLRAHNLTEENQAVTVTTDTTSHKIVMDVHEFMDGEVKVKLVGEREVVVEGRTKTTNGEFSLSCQCFRRRFSLPDLIDLEAITSVMSSDGILTITLPKLQVNQIKDNSTIIPIRTEENVSTNTDHKSTSTSVSQAASSKSTSTTNSKSFEVQVNKRDAQECQLNEHHKNTTGSTPLTNGVKDTMENWNTAVNGENNSQKKVCQQFGDNITSTKKSDVSISSSTQTEDQVSGETRGHLRQEHKLSGESVNTNSSRDAHRVDEKQCSGESSTSHFLRATTLPITSKGLFFSDSFFQDAWNDFQDAVKEVVSKWGHGSSNIDDMTCYRSLRTSDMRDETQAVKSSQDEFNYKFIVDVQDFTDGGEITVKSVNNRELVVEGRVEKEEGGSRYTKKFLRRFVVPGDIYLESVTSVMSADGVLTITVPKKPPTLHIKEVIVPMTVEEGGQKKESFNQSSSNTLRTGVETQASEPCPAVSVKTDDSSNSSSVNLSSCSSASTQSSLHEESSSRHHSSLTSNMVGRGRERIIPVEAVEQDDSQPQTFVKNNMNTEEEKCSTSHEKRDVSVRSKSVTEKNINSSEVNTKVGPQLSEGQDDHKVTEAETQSKANKNINIDVDSSVNQHSRSQRVKSSCVYDNRVVPITLKGAFFSDRFFEHARDSYMSAVKDVLKRTHEGSFLSDDITSYRSLRERDLREENQAVRVEEDQQSLKIVMDAYDFIGGDVKVEVVGGKEVVVEGRVSKDEGSSAATQTFLLRFSLPRCVNLEAITSAMSSDGVLTIISPKLQQSTESETRNKEMFMESKSRKDTQSDGGQAWEERNVSKSAQESEGCSSRTFSSSYRSQQQYSSRRQF